MHIDFLLKVFEENKKRDAVIWQETVYSYEWLLSRIRYWQEILVDEGLNKDSVVALEADFSPNSLALFLALMEHGSIIVPLTSPVGSGRSRFTEIAQCEFSIYIDKDDKVNISSLPYKASHPLYKRLKESTHPGLVLFSSGSTGESKAAVHDLPAILEKFKVRRQSYRTITFLLYDHIGGINTMLYTLSNAGCVATVKDRSPDSILSAIDKYRVELLPTTPTFINLILISEAYKRHNLDALKVVTYGTEPMSETTLRSFNKLFPNIKLLQTYGLSEVGILRTKSESSDSLWVKVGGEGFKTRVIDGVLQIKAKSAMLGYLNAPTPFTDDGWFDTGDHVEVNGEYIKILGRRSEIINVGGEKVYPAEVENIIKEIKNVGEVTVYGEKNPITGNIVCARVSLLDNTEPKKFISSLKRLCRVRLQSYKVPVKVEIVDKKQHNERFKKLRSLTGSVR